EALRQVDGDVDGTGHLGFGSRLKYEFGAVTGLDGLRSREIRLEFTVVDDVLGQIGLTFVLVRRHGRVLLEVGRPGVEVGQARLLEIPLGEGREVVTAGGE